jgi:RiboL-PSP-HEPN
MVPTAFADKAAMREHAGAVREVISALEDDTGFRTSIGRATADRRRMLYRIGLVAALFRSVGVPVALREGLGLDDPEAISQ